jgi:hypothetical protein
MSISLTKLIAHAAKSVQKEIVSTVQHSVSVTTQTLASPAISLVGDIPGLITFADNNPFVGPAIPVLNKPSLFTVPVDTTPTLGEAVHRTEIDVIGHVLNRQYGPFGDI